VGTFEATAGHRSSWIARDEQGRRLPAGQYRLRLVDHPDYSSHCVILLR